MPRFEYKVVPAPSKGLRGKGVKGAEARFSHGLQELMNGLAGYGWEYLRAETLPSIERSGLTGTTTEWRNVLVFRRLRDSDADAFAPELLPAPTATPPATARPSEPEKPAEKPTAEGDDPWDNGVEGTGNMEGIGRSLSSLAASRKHSKTDD